jgi:hypothetical protein
LQSKSAIDTEGDSDPDTDGDGAFQAALSGLKTKASGFAGGSLLAWEIPRLCRGGSKGLTDKAVEVG